MLADVSVIMLCYVNERATCFKETVVWCTVPTETWSQHVCRDRGRMAASALSLQVEQCSMCRKTSGKWSRS
jgi:hypothetical protein